MNKSLEALEYIRLSGHCAFDDKYFECLDTIEKELKAFDIIKNKRVDVELLMKVTSAKDYNKYSNDSNRTHCLGDREFDLLREVLLCD